MTEANAGFRALAIEALLDNPGARIGPGIRERLDDPAGDVTFEELDMDSLGRMELAIWLELRLQIELTEAQVQVIGSSKGLENYLRANLPAGKG